jgi:nucleoside permease NupC
LLERYDYPGEVATMLLAFVALVALADAMSAWLRKVIG